MSDFLNDIRPVDEHLPAFSLDEITFLPVIDNPDKIFCVGMNYQDKRIEFEQTIDAPTLFVRFPDSLTAHSAELCKPESSNEFDYEGELAVIMGKYASNVSCDNALQYVATALRRWLIRCLSCRRSTGYGLMSGRWLNGITPLFLSSTRCSTRG